MVAQQEIDDAHGRDLVAQAQLDGAKSRLAAAMQKVNVNRSDLARVSQNRSQGQTIYFWDGFSAASTMAFSTGISFSGGAVLLKLRIYA